jgi:hypothetical protein
MLALVALACALAAAPADPRVWIGAGLTGGAGVGDAVGGGGGANVSAAVALGRNPARAFGLVGRLRDGWVSNDTRNFGNIGLAVRYPSGTGPYVTVGFAHNHEAPLALYVSHPVGVSAGIDPALTHRTGVEAGVGWDGAAPFPRSRFGHRFSPTVALTALVFPDPGGPPLYVLGEVGVRFGVDGLFGHPAAADQSPS